MTRTDIHRPSAPEFDPEAYDCWGVFDTCTDPLKGGGSQIERIKLVQTLIERGYQHGPGSAHQCGHCGANLRYCALVVREDAKQFIFVGETCLDGRFELTKGEFDALRKSAQLDRERHRLLTAFAALCEATPALAYATYTQNIREALGEEAVRYAGLDWGLGTVADIARKARQYGEASTRQLALVERIIAEQGVKLAAYEAKQAAKAAEPKAEALTAGRQVIEGVIVSVKEVDDPYSYCGGVIVKITVKLDGGQRVYGTLPSALGHADKGSRVRFTAAVKVSDDDEAFGFYKRPTKPEILAVAVAA